MPTGQANKQEQVPAAAFSANDLLISHGSHQLKLWHFPVVWELTSFLLPNMLKVGRVKTELREAFL